MFGWLKNIVGSGESGGVKPGSKEYARDILGQAYEAYRLARKDRPREHYQPHGYSGDSAIIGSHDLMNRRTRDLFRNTSQGKRIVTALADLIVGTGMQTYSWPFAPSELFEIVTELESLQAGELGPRLAFALESDDLFDEWANDPKQFDVEGRLSWPEMQRMMMQESALVGNGLLIRSILKNYKRIPLAYQIVEREQLDETRDRPASNGQNRIVGGIEMDGSNRVFAYHLYLDHPHEFFGVSNSALQGAGAPISSGTRRVRIEASRVIDLATFHRPSASLGVSWLDASGQSIWDSDAYKDSEIRSAALDAVFAYVAKLEDAEQSGALGFADGTDDSDGYGNRTFKVGHSPVAAVIGKEESLEMVRQTRPNKDAPHFLKLLDRDIASAAGLSYYTMSGDYEATSFSSARGAKLDEDLHIKPLQNWFATHVALPVRREFNAIAAATGQFSSITPAEFRKNERTYQRFDAVGNGRDLLDPYKEGEARTTRLRTGLSTFKEECAKTGKHWIRVLMQIAVERKVAEMFGIQLDFSKGGGSGDAEETTEPQEEAVNAKQAS
jgi:lambda family phage portal protein